MQEFIKIHPNDNVAVALCPLAAGRTLTVDSEELVLAEDIPQGHKFALSAIPKGEQVVKYGSPIGFTKEPVGAGAWVHTHNLKTGLGDVLTYSYDRQATPLAPSAPAFFRVIGGQTARSESATISGSFQPWAVSTM